MPDALYVYAIVDRETPLPARDGGRDTAPLALIPWRDLAAVTARADGDAVRLTTEAALRHASIVEAVRRHGPALPVRFGTMFRDERSVSAELAARYERLTDDLARLGDKVELSLTVLSPLPDESSGLTGGGKVKPETWSAGARYLRARAAELRAEETRRARARALADEVDAALDRFILDRRVTLLPTPGMAVRTAYLLDAERVKDCVARFADLRRRRSDMRALLTGPWPPYSFMTMAETPGSNTPEGRLAALTQLLTVSMMEDHGCSAVARA